MGLTRVRRLGARWCCQLCVKLVSELSNQCCSHLRSWQSAVVCEPQTHFRITPLSLISLHYPFSAHFIPHSSSVHSSLSFLLSLPFLATFLLFCLLYFPTCAPPLPPLYDSVVSHPFSQNTLPGFLHPLIFSHLGFFPPIFKFFFFPLLTSLRLLPFIVSNLKCVCYRGDRRWMFIELLQTCFTAPQMLVCSKMMHSAFTPLTETVKSM